MRRLRERPLVLVSVSDRGRQIWPPAPGSAGNPDVELTRRLDRIEAALGRLLDQRATKDWYTTAEVARLLGRVHFTVREWCRLKRVNARKRACGRGQSQEWVISHTELERIRNEGLLPQPTGPTRPG
jgi:hypothetical protein